MKWNGRHRLFLLYDLGQFGRADVHVHRFAPPQLAVVLAPGSEEYLCKFLVACDPAHVVGTRPHVQTLGKQRHVLAWLSHSVIDFCEDGIALAGDVIFVDAATYCKLSVDSTSLD